MAHGTARAGYPYFLGLTGFEIGFPITPSQFGPTPQGIHPGYFTPSQASPGAFGRDIYLTRHNTGIQTIGGKGCRCAVHIFFRAIATVGHAPTCLGTHIVRGTSSAPLGPSTSLQNRPSRSGFIRSYPTGRGGLHLAPVVDTPPLLPDPLQSTICHQAHIFQKPTFHHGYRGDSPQPFDIGPKRGPHPEYRHFGFQLAFTPPRGHHLLCRPSSTGMVAKSAGPLVTNQCGIPPIRGQVLVEHLCDLGPDHPVKHILLRGFGVSPLRGVQGGNI